MIISCRNSIDLSNKIATFTKLDVVMPKITEFTASEMLVEIPKNCSNNEIYIVQSLSCYANNQIMELLLTINAAKHSRAKKIHLILPYIAYSRQDKEIRNTSCGMEVIANLLNSSGISSVITVDIHNKSSLNLFDMPVINIDTTEFISSSNKDKLIVMPDAGSMKRSRLLSDNSIYLEKTRNNDDISFKIFGEVKGKDCLIIDDIIDSGKTLCIAAKYLMDNGANSVEAYATHAFLSKETCDRIDGSDIINFTISNSIKQQYLPKNSKIIDISELIYNSLNIKLC